MNSTGRQLVSAVLAVRNEQRYIEASLRSLLQQQTPNFDLEIIVVDGESTDATRAIVERIALNDSRIRLAINKRMKTPYAFNLGIQLARGEYICICGAHSVYSENYISVCLQELQNHSAVGCSGREIVRPGEDGLQAKIVAWVLAHPFGTSTGSMRTRGAGFADTIPYPVFRKSALIEVGGYDSRLHRNQDNDLSQKLRARGYTLYMTDRTSCEYFVIPNLWSLTKYSFRTGFWNVLSFKNNPASMSMRHFVPGLFVMALILSILMFLSAPGVTGDAQWLLSTPVKILMIAYGTFCIVGACHVLIREKCAGALLMPLAFVLLHVAYGIGILSAIASNARSVSSGSSAELETAESP
jgi:succinoglycan biosynthesis protein ExoA